MNDVTTWIQNMLGLPPAAQSRIFTTLIALLSLWILHQLLVKLIIRPSQTIATRYRWRRAISYSIIGIGILLIGRVWFEGIDSLATYLGLLSAGLAIALQELLVSLAGWLFIIWRRPFELGDRIQIGEHIGDVVDINIFQVTLLEVGNWVAADQITGRIIHIPNGKVFSEPQANYNQAFRYIWNEIPILVTFESDWKKAKQILHDIGVVHAEHLGQAAELRLRQESQRFMITQPRLLPSVYTSVSESGVLLTMRYLCEPQERREKAQAIWEDVLDAFALHPDINFAYPTQREIHE